MCIMWKRREGYTSFEEKMKAIFKDFKDGREVSENYTIRSFCAASDLLFGCKDAPVRIIGDYDTDGISSVIILRILFKELKFKDVEHFIPDRQLDGYGASPAIVDCLCNGKELNGKKFTKPEKQGLLITVDNGIAAVEAVRRARNLGWQVLILDHHLPPVNNEGKIIYPDADVIIDPHAVDCGADFIDYCGAGLSYKLACYINDNVEKISDNAIAKMCGMAAIATIGDNVKLVEEYKSVYGYDNYLIVKRGLFELTQNSGRTTGMYCLFAGINQAFETVITPDDVGYLISPVMNAVSRLVTYGSDKVVDLFLQDDNDFVTAATKAKELVDINTFRKEYTDKLIPELILRIQSEHLEDNYPLVICGKPGEIHPGVLGLVAGRLAEEYHTAVIVFTPVDNGVLKGSARAQEGTNIKELLDVNKELILGYGGHALAAGLSVKQENFESFIKAIQKSAGEKPKELFYKYYDYEITPEQAKYELEKIEKYFPLGCGIEEPVYKVNFTADLKKGCYYQILGSEKNVLKLLNNHANAISFRGMIDKYVAMGEPAILTLYGKLGTNIWNGVSYPQILIEDMEY